MHSSRIRKKRKQQNLQQLIAELNLTGLLRQQQKHQGPAKSRWKTWEEASSGNPLSRAKKQQKQAHFDAESHARIPEQHSTAIKTNSDPDDWSN